VFLQKHPFRGWGQIGRKSTGIAVKNQNGVEKKKDVVLNRTIPQNRTYYPGLFPNTFLNFSSPFQFTLT